MPPTTPHNLQAALDLAGRGWRVLPVHSPSRRQGLCSCGNAECHAVAKHPRLAGWQDDASTDAATVSAWWDQWPGANVGVAFGVRTGLIDLEVDPRNGGDVSLARLEALLGPLPATPTFRSGGGGLHRLFRYPPGQRVRKATHAFKDVLEAQDSKAQTGIDIISDGGQALCPPSVHASGNAYAWTVHPDDVEAAPLPDLWIAALQGQAPPDDLALLDGDPSAAQGYDAEALLALSGSSRLPDVSLAVARAMLAYVSADCSYQDWTAAGQAIRHQFGDTQEARDLFRDWSMTAAERYPGDAALAKQWASYGKREATARVVTFRSIVSRAHAGGYAPLPPSGPTVARQEREALREADALHLSASLRALRRAQTDMELAEVAADIRQTELFDGTRKSLEDEYQRHYTRIHPGKKISKATVSELLDDSAEAAERAKALAQQDGWYEGFIYTAETDLGGFYHVDTGQALSVKVFNDIYSARLVTPIQKAQGKITPAWLPSALVLNCELVPKVQGVRYMPGQTTLFMAGPLQYVNRYRGPEGEPLDPIMHSGPEAAACRRVESHLSWMLGPERGRLVRQFLAYITGNPGERVRWCFVIVGPKGHGKTFLSTLARVALGNANVKDLGQASLSHTSFNGWAEGSQLTTIEEIRIDGAKKWEIMNALKAVITNDVIDIHKKGHDPYTAHNTASFLAYTNDENALAVSPDDRRYFVCNTVYNSAAGFIRSLGGPLPARQYFTDLFGTLTDCPDALRGWLADTDMTGFDPNRAPESSEKVSLAKAAASDLDVAIESAIQAQPCPEIGPALLSVEALRASLMAAEDVREISGQGLARILRGQGWRPACVSGAVNATGRALRWYYQPDLVADLGVPRTPPEAGISSWIRAVIAAQEARSGV